MGATVVIGAQWGDEGKGKVVDRYAADAHAVVRFQGGANAGHTIVVGGQKTPLHVLPSGIMRSGMRNIVGPGVLVDLDVASTELDHAERCGAKVYFDHSAPIALPMHRVIDGVRELAAGMGAIGTTRRGIGPGYSDFWARRGVKMGDLRVPDAVRTALMEGGHFAELHNIARHHDPGAAHLVPGMDIDPYSLDDTVDWCVAHGKRFASHLADTRKMVWQMLADDREVLFEGAQGVLLDIFHGSWPYCTSSPCTAAGVSATFGVYEFARVVGVVKAYATRVGAGPFPTELDDAVGKELRDRGQEFGTTTGRPRRCGWLDCVALRHACRVGGITELVVTKLDVLSGFPGLQIADAYVFDDIIEKHPGALTNTLLRAASPMWESVEGWDGSLEGATTLDELPPAAVAYLERIVASTGAPISGVGVGADRDAFIPCCIPPAMRR
ncbi:adenylosuccinate synthase [Candidatus Uhrbacteria bacterium]|nr:adenylosuccinate synthase [Candidatus Uhrbacteria bacterium]